MQTTQCDQARLALILNAGKYLGLASVSLLAILSSSPGAQAQFLCADTSGSNGGATAVNTTDIACGPQAHADGSSGAAAYPGQAIAIGYKSNAANFQAIAIGSESSATGDGSTAIGPFAKATGARSFAAGFLSKASAGSGVAIGYDTVASGSAGIAMGDRAAAIGDSTIAFGRLASATGNYSVTAGFSSAANGAGAVALGGFSGAKGDYSVATGYEAAASGSGAVALGVYSNASDANSVALGSNSKTSAAVPTGGAVLNGQAYTFAGTAPFSTVSIGVSGTERTITNVAAGRISSTSTDAINGSELYATNQAVGVLGTKVTNLDNRVTTVEGDVTNILDGRAGLVRQVGGAPGSGTVTVGAETGGTLIDMTGTDGKRKVTGVANGDVAATSFDAINGSQLHGVSQSIVNHLGGGSSVGPNGAIIGPIYTVQGKSYTTIYDSFGAVDNSLTTIKTNITNLGGQINGVASDALLWSSSKGAFSASHGGSSSNKITNVADGALNATSSDAVNGSQLFATNKKVEQNTTDIANLDHRVTNVEGDITKLDNRVTTVENKVSLVSTTVTNQGTQIAALEKGAVKYTLDSNGNPTNEVKLTGDGSGSAVTVKNIATGVDDTDAVNVGQLRAAVDQVGAGSTLAVKYVGDANGKPTNTVALTGDGTGSPVTIQHVAPGKADTDAANYGQIKNQVAYDTDATGTRTNTISLSGNNGAPVRISNVANGVKDGDAVNLSQLNGVRADAHAYTDTKVADLKNYTDARLDNLSGNIREAQQEARGGIASVMAASQLRYDDRPGVLSIAGGFGGFKGQTSFATGLGWTSQDQQWRVNGSMGVSLNTGDVTWGVGASYSFE